MPSTSTPSTMNQTDSTLLRSITQNIPRPQMDTETCSLLGPFAIAVQGMMALIVLASLLFKRHREHPKRKFRIWTADVSKQVIGQAFVHMLNIWISASLATLPSKGNPCALYFINIFIDTTIGVFILYLALKLITQLVVRAFRGTPTSLGLCSGIYPTPFLVSWSKQLGIYLSALIILKIIVVWLFWVGGEALVNFANGIMESVSSNARVQIVVVVMIGPTFLNVLQFLLIDSFLKGRPRTRSRSASEVRPGDQDGQGRNGSSDSTRFLRDPNLEEQESESDQDRSYQSIFNKPNFENQTIGPTTTSHNPHPSNTLVNEHYQSTSHLRTKNHKKNFKLTINSEICLPSQEGLPKFELSSPVSNSLVKNHNNCHHENNTLSQNLMSERKHHIPVSPTVLV